MAFLDIKPPHFDEGINGWFCDQMAKTGYYAYDPTNYHGPLHFYILFTSLQLFGRNLWALRLPVVLASLLTIFWMFLFRPFFGRTVCYLAAFGMAISPGFIFYDRYSIHESWLVFFLMVAFWGILGISTSREPKYFWAFILGLTGMILTKETYIIHLAAFAAAGLLVSILNKLLPSSSVPSGPELDRTGGRFPVQHVAGATLVGVALIIFFYSGNFRNWKGLEGLYQTFLPWTKTAVDAAGHAKADFDLFPVVPPFLAHFPVLGAFANFKLNWYWIRLLLDYEWFTAAGLLFSFRFFLGGNPALRYLALYGLGVLLVYSIVPYKTPWCIISIVWPFLFLGAAFLEFIAKRLNRLVAVLVALPLFAHAAWKSYDLNFVRFDNAKERYVYVQTFREYRDFVNPILEKGAKNPERQRPACQVLCFYPVIFQFRGLWAKSRTSAISVQTPTGPRNWMPTLSWSQKKRPKTWKRVSRIDISQRIFDFVTVWTNVARISGTKPSRTFSPIVNQSSSRGDRPNELFNRCPLLDSQFQPPGNSLLLFAPGTDNIDFHCCPSPWIDSSGRPDISTVQKETDPG